MLSHLGLRSRMAGSYMLVSAAAVLLVEIALLVVMVPRVRGADEAAHEAQERAVEAEMGQAQLYARSLARGLAASVGAAATVTASASPGSTDEVLIAGAAAETTDLAGDDPGGSGTAQFGAVTQVVADVNGRIVAANPRRAATDLPPAARSGAPADGRMAGRDRNAYWATAPIRTIAVAGMPHRTIGIAYIELATTKPDPGGGTAPTATPAEQPEALPSGGVAKDPVTTVPSRRSTVVSSLVLPGIVALVLLIPVGALFGLLSTGRLIRRIRRLSDGTSAMADGDLRVRVPVSGGDEVGRLERAFNAMVERLEVAVDEQRVAAGAEARRAERDRIARELHDSISQELFSVSMVAAGMRKALDPGSVLREQAGSMERSLARTMREMRALLLELRPVRLEDAGLAAALAELCRAYETRLGITITASLDPVPLDATAEHAVLRVVQEALGNAVRHGEPSRIEVRLGAVGDLIELTVHDDGRGFDPAGAGERHGMGLAFMRERLREVGGAVEIDSSAGHGTTVRVRLGVPSG